MVSKCPKERATLVPQSQVVISVQIAGGNSCSRVSEMVMGCASSSRSRF